MTELNEPGAEGRKPRRRAKRQSGPPVGGTSEGIEPTSVPAGKGAAGTTVTESASAGKSEAADSTVKLASPAADTEPSTGSSAGSGKGEPTATSDASELADTSDGADAADAGKSGRLPGKLGWLGWIAAAVAVVSAVVLVGSGGFLIYHQRHVDAMQQQRSEYIQTAKQVVLNLTNISGDTAPKDIDRVLSVASGQLKAEYSERKDAYAKVVQQAKVKASGQIIETAIETEDDHTARVLVAAEQTLTNAGSPKPQQRYYRFRVTVTRDDAGHLSGSQVEFVA